MSCQIYISESLFLSSCLDVIKCHKVWQSPIHTNILSAWKVNPQTSNKSADFYFWKCCVVSTQLQYFIYRVKKLNLIFEMWQYWKQFWVFTVFGMKCHKILLAYVINTKDKKTFTTEMAWCVLLEFCMLFSPFCNKNASKMCLTM